MENALSDLVRISTFGWCWVVIAIASSLILAFRRVFRDPHEAYPLKDRKRSSPRFVYFSDCYYSFFFNFAGSMAGWLLLLALYARIRSDTALSSLGWADLVLGLLAFVGISGHLPQTAYGLVLSVSRLVDVLAERIAAKTKEGSSPEKPPSPT